MVVPNAKRIDDSAVAIRAPMMIGVQLAYRAGASSAGTIGSMATVILTQSKKREHCQDDNNQADEVDQTVHFLLLALN
jgi:hypothetical protein